MRLVTPLAFAGVLAITAPLSAQTAAQDVQCLMASNIFSQTEKDAGRKRIAETAKLFYLGRVDARLSGGQLRDTMSAQAKSITANNVGPIMTGCAKTMQTKMAAVQAIGEASRPKGK
jgi:hypothetical protein